MSYDVLISAWNTASAVSGAVLPSNVTGAFLAGKTTDEKIAAINAWTLPDPKPALLNPTEIINACNAADVAALTSAQSTLFTLLLQGNPVDASANTTVRNTLMAIFAGHSQTLAQLSALFAPFDNATELWVTAPVANGGAGLTGTVNSNDAAAAGLT